MLGRTVKLQLAIVSGVVSLAIAGAAHAGMYLDTATPDLKPEERAKVANPQPVQLLFQFKTKGAQNARATKFLKAKVLETVKASGLFTEVGETPQSNGAILNISIDDTADTGAAAQQGFVTGLTFGLKGSIVADNYECVVDYVASPTAPKITKIQHHRLLTTIGLTDPPPNTEKAANSNEAVYTMARQVVARDLNDLALDPAFSAAAAAPAASPQTTDAIPATAQPAGVAPTQNPAAAQ